MEIPKYAVIDLGTNTFTMLIASPIANGNFEALHRERYHVRLAEGGITTIATAPYHRAIQALQNFQQSILDFGVSQVRAMGTAALRTASNGAQLVHDIFSKTSIQVEIIGGDLEADLIYEGVRFSYDFEAANDIIMDIGGGSVEFIIANQNGKVWAQSFPVGVAILRQRFHLQEPIQKADIQLINEYLRAQLAPLLMACAKNPVRHLIGASGTFDVLERIYAKERISNVFSMINDKDVHDFYQKIINLNTKERSELEYVTEIRAEMIVVAMILVHFVVDALQTQKVGISAYALREGLMGRMLRDSGNYLLQ